MWFNYKDIDFEYNEQNVDEFELKRYFSKIIEIAKKEFVDIVEIEAEEKDCFMIYIEKQGVPEAWDEPTLKFVKALSNEGISVMLADEDYGEDLDVLIIYK